MTGEVVNPQAAGGCRGPHPRAAVPPKAHRRQGGDLQQPAQLHQEQVLPDEPSGLL